MMTGTLGAVMWLMMGLMMAAMAGGAITWARRRTRRRIGQRSEPRPAADNARRRWPRRS